MLDDNLSRRILTYAAIFGSLGITIGAFGAHFLPDFLVGRGLEPDLVTKRLSQFETGARYHLMHAVALLALASNPYGSPASRRWTARFFAIGIVIFSGSLYVLVLFNIPKLGAITPIGGVAWIIGWLMLLWVGYHGRKKTKKFAQIHGKTP